MKANCTNSNL